MTPPHYLQTMDINRETPAQPWSPPFRLLKFYESQDRPLDEWEMKIAEMAAADVRADENKEAEDLIAYIRLRHGLKQP